VVFGVTKPMRLLMRDIQEGICCRLTSSLFQVLLLSPSKQLNFGGAVDNYCPTATFMFPGLPREEPKKQLSRGRKAANLRVLLLLF